MRKPFLKIVLVIFVFFISYQIVSAFAFNPFSYITFFPKFIGGVIYSTGEAPEITAQKASGYDCNLEGGSTIQIQTGSQAPETYYIPGYVQPVTNTTPMQGQSILGRSNGEKSITCTKDEEGKRGGFFALGKKKIVYSVVTIKFPEINYFGTSQFENKKYLSVPA